MILKLPLTCFGINARHQEIEERTEGFNFEPISRTSYILLSMVAPSVIAAKTPYWSLSSHPYTQEELNNLPESEKKQMAVLTPESLYFLLRYFNPLSSKVSWVKILNNNSFDSFSLSIWTFLSIHMRTFFSKQKRKFY